MNQEHNSLFAYVHEIEVHETNVYPDVPKLPKTDQALDRAEQRKERAEAIQHELDRCNGTESYTRHPLFPKLLYTDGVATMAELCKAYWLIDAIASHEPRIFRDPKLASLRDFRVWTLNVEPDGSGLPRRATLTCRADSGERPKIIQVIEYTDFPLDSIDVWGEGEVLLLPSEH